MDKNMKVYKLNRRNTSFAGDEVTTEYILKTIKVLLKTMPNRKYMTEYTDKEARECFMMVRRYCIKEFKHAEPWVILRTLARMRDELIELPNSCWNQIIYRWTDDPELAGFVVRTDK